MRPSFQHFNTTRKNLLKGFSYVEILKTLPLSPNDKSRKSVQALGVSIVPISSGLAQSSQLLGLVRASAVLIIVFSHYFFAIDGLSCVVGFGDTIFLFICPIARKVKGSPFSSFAEIKKNSSVGIQMADYKSQDTDRSCL